MKNKFITFEGGEGAGKSTQIKLLAEFLQSQGQEVVVTREPGGTENGEKIRDLLLNGDGWDALTEVLLNFAARNEHVEKLIKPALARGAWVLSDRFYDSTYVYQGYGQGQDIKKIDEIRMAVLGGFAPDITLVLDIDPEVALKRAIERGDVNRFEKMGVEFHHKVRDGFLKLAAENARIKVIDASQAKEVVCDAIIQKIK